MNYGKSPHRPLVQVFLDEHGLPSRLAEHQRDHVESDASESTWWRLHNTAIALMRNEEGKWTVERYPGEVGSGRRYTAPPVWGDPLLTGVREMVEVESRPHHHIPFAHEVKSCLNQEVAEAVAASSLPIAVFERVRALASQSGFDVSSIEWRADNTESIDQLLLMAASALSPQLQDAVSSDPLQAARDRGLHRALQELQRPENLSLRDAAEYSGRSDAAINGARQKNQLYALVSPGKQRGLRYPQWQFEAATERLQPVLEQFAQASASCWAVHGFMHSPLDELGGVRPLEWILDAAKPIEPVVQAVASRYNSDQGAG